MRASALATTFALSLAATTVAIIGASEARTDTSDAASPGASNCPAFHFPSRSAEGRRSLLQRATVYLDVSGGHGTAFLIDREAGLFLTAAHVVREHLKTAADDRKPISGYNQLHGSDPIHLNVVDGRLTSAAAQVAQWHSFGNDIALLEAVDPKQLGGFRALELAFSAPDADQEVIFAGYGPSSAQTAIARLSDPVRLSYTSNTQKGGVYLLDTAVRGGDSGAPVVLAASGVVVGMVMAEVDRQRAVVHSIRQYDQFIVGNVIQRMTTELQDMILEAKTDRGVRALAVRLKPSLDTPYDDNLRLIRAIAWLKQSDKLGGIPDGAIECPLRQAVDQRLLARWGDEVRFEMSRRQATPFPDLLIKHGRLYEDAGERALAAYYYNRAVVALAEELGETLNYGSGGIALASAWQRGGEISPVPDNSNKKLSFALAKTNVFAAMSLDPSQTIGGWAISRGPARHSSLPVLSHAGATDGGSASPVAPVSDPTPRVFSLHVRSDRVARQLHDYATAILKANALHPEPSAPLEAAASAARIGMLTAAGPAWRRRNALTLGTTLSRQKDWAGALAAYRTAWQDGARSDHVLREARWAMTNATGSTQNAAQVRAALNSGKAFTATDIMQQVIGSGEARYLVQQPSPRSFIGTTGGGSTFGLPPHGNLWLGVRPDS